MLEWLRVKKHRPLPQDIDLLQEAQNGSRYAFGSLYLQHVDTIYRFAFFRVGGDQHTAEDITSKVFIKAWKGLSRFKKQETGTFRSWLLRIAHTTIIDHYRSTKAHAPLPDDIPATDKTDQIAEQIDSQKALLQVLGTLTDTQRIVVTLTYFEDISTKEIASIVGRNEDAVRAIRSRALRKIQDMMRRTYNM